MAHGHLRLAPPSRLVSPWRIARGRFADPCPTTVYLGAKFSAQVAQNALLAALLVTAGTRSDASIGLSSFLVAMLVPSILLGPVGGSIVDRLGPGPSYAVGACGRALAVLPAFFLLGTPQMVWVVAVLYSSASQIFTPAEHALVRDVQGARPGRIYSALTVAQYAGQGVGILIIAPMLFFLGGQPAVFLGVIAIFSVTAVLGTSLVAMGLGRGATAKADAERVGFRSVGRFLLADGRAFYAVVALTLSGIISRVLIVSLPGYVRDEIDIGALGMLFVLVPGALGLVAGLVYTSRNLSVAKSERMLRISSMALLGSLFFLAFMDHGVSFAARNSHVTVVQAVESWANTTAAIVIPAAVAGGFGLCVVVMSARFVLTELSPRGGMGRVHAVQCAISESVLVLPVMLAGVATTVAGTRLTLTIVGALALGTLAVTEWRRAERALAETSPVFAQPGTAPAPD